MCKQLSQGIPLRNIPSIFICIVLLCAVFNILIPGAELQLIFNIFEGPYIDFGAQAQLSVKQPWWIWAKTTTNKIKVKPF